MALTRLRKCPACGKPGINIFERLFLPAWRPIYCRSCGAAFRLARIWRWFRVTVPMFVGVPAMYVAFWVPDPPYRIAAVLVIAAILILHAYQPIVREDRPDGPG